MWLASAATCPRRRATDSGHAAGSGAGRPASAKPIDDVVHQRVRLGILAIAHEARRVEFGYLRTNLELTAGNLSQHLSVLESAGLITIEKGYAGKRPRTWITLTKAGRAALVEEITQLKLLISRIERTGTSRN